MRRSHRIAQNSDYYDGPLTRAMKNRLDNGDKLMDGLEDEQEVRRIVYTPRKV